jgi:hypothetical protein
VACRRVSCQVANGDKMQHCMATLLVLLLFQFTSAEQIFIGNREFTGPVSGSGALLKVGLEPLVQALGLESKYDSGGWIVSRNGIDEQATGRSGTVLVEGTYIALETGPEGPMVNLSTFLAPLSMEAESNSALGIVDVKEVRGKSTSTALSSGGMAGPKKVVMQYYEALRHFPAITSFKELANARKVTRSFRTMVKDMKPLVTPEMLVSMEENQRVLTERVTKLGRITRGLTEEQLKAELAKDPRVKDFFDRFFNMTKVISWMRPASLEEEIDGSQATVFVTLPERHGEVPDPVAVSLVKIQDKWLIDRIDGKRVGTGFLD